MEETELTIVGWKAKLLLGMLCGLVLFLIIASYYRTQPGDVKQLLENRLEVTPTDVLAEVKTLRVEVSEIKAELKEVKKKVFVE